MPTGDFPPGPPIEKKIKDSMNVPIGELVSYYDGQLHELRKSFDTRVTFLKKRVEHEAALFAGTLNSSCASTKKMLDEERVIAVRKLQINVDALETNADVAKRDLDEDDLRISVRDSILFHKLTYDGIIDYWVKSLEGKA